MEVENMSERLPRGECAGQFWLVAEDEDRDMMSADVADQVSPGFVIEIRQAPAKQGEWGAREFRKIETERHFALEPGLDAVWGALVT